MLEVGVDACTDITGFGLLGHLCELVETSKKGAEIDVSRVPMIEPAPELAKDRVVPGGTLANLKYAEEKVDWDKGVMDDQKLILCDAQTSGGLLICVPEEKGDRLLDNLNLKGVSEAAVIGRIIEDEECRIQVKRK
jgi:selenide,water dikinase